jgi:hypothetical protein
MRAPWRFQARLSALALIAAVVGCHPAVPPRPLAPPAPPAAPRPAEPPPAPSELDLLGHADPSTLRVTLTLAENRVKSTTDLAIRVVVTNTGPEPYPYSTWFLAAASLHLQARGLDGMPLPVWSPPVPREFDPTEREVIPPGGSFVLQYTGWR